SSCCWRSGGCRRPGCRTERARRPESPMTSVAPVLAMPIDDAPAAAATLSVDIGSTLRARSGSFDLQLRFATTARRVVVCGPSGAGKSLTLQAIAGLLRPQRGRIVLLDRCLFDSAAGVDVPSRRRDVGYLFQDYALFPHLTVRQNVAFGLARSVRNPRTSARDPRAERWLAALGIDTLGDRYPDQLSGGQRQRTAL